MHFIDEKDYVGSIKTRITDTMVLVPTPCSEAAKTIAVPRWSPVKHKCPHKDGQVDLHGHCQVCGKDAMNLVST